MTKAFRILVAAIGTVGVVSATNVGMINPMGDLLIVVLIAALIVLYLRKVAELGYVLSVLVVILAAVLASVIYQNVPSTFYKSGLIVLGVSAFVMFGDLLMHWRSFARASAGRSRPSNDLH